MLLDLPVYEIGASPHSSLRVGTLNAIIKAIASHKGIDKNQVISFLSIH